MSGLDKHWEQIYRDKGNGSDAAVGERMSNMWQRERQKSVKMGQKRGAPRGEKGGQGEFESEWRITGDLCKSEPKKGKQVKRMKVVKMSKMLDMKCMQIHVCLKSVEIKAGEDIPNTV